MKGSLIGMKNRAACLGFSGGPGSRRAADDREVVPPNKYPAACGGVLYSYPKNSAAFFMSFMFLLSKFGGQLFIAAA